MFEIGSAELGIQAGQSFRSARLKARGAMQRVAGQIGPVERKLHLSVAEQNAYFPRREMLRLCQRDVGAPEISGGGFGQAKFVPGPRISRSETNGLPKILSGANEIALLKSQLAGALQFLEASWRVGALGEDSATGDKKQERGERPRAHSYLTVHWTGAHEFNS
jgi:hypothetical protein